MSTNQPQNPGDDAPRHQPSARAGSGAGEINRALDDLIQEIEAVDQDALDSLIANAPHPLDQADPGPGPKSAPNPEPTPQASSESPEESEPPLDPAIRNELTALADGNPDETLSGGAGDDRITASAMDERLDAPATATSPEKLAPESLDDDLTEPVSPEPDSSGAPASPPDPGPPPANTASNDEDRQKTTEAIGGENIAAAGTAETVSPPDLTDDLLTQLASEVGAQPPAPRAEQPGESGAPLFTDDIPASDDPFPEDEPAQPEPSHARDSFQAPSPDDEPSETPKPRRLPTPRILAFLVAVIRHDPWRVASSLAAGLLFALGTFTYLYTNQLRPTPDLAAGPLDASGLARVMAQARDLMAAGRAGEAADRLTRAINAVPPSPERVDARYLLVEAQVRALPPVITDRHTDAIHAAIDDLIREARAHPQAAEALLWKAKLYEETHNPIAARSTYRELLNNFGNAEQLDRVLAEFANLEITNHRPEEALELLHRLFDEFPSTPILPRARLLLGDAHAALGATDRARAIYVEIADTYSDARLGGDAYERLGRLALDTGDYPSAIRELETRLETATTVDGNDRVYLMLARAYRANGQLDDARNLLNELIELFPESPAKAEAHILLSQVLHDSGLASEAVRFATQSVQRYPNNPAILRNAGELLARSGDAAAAARALVAADRAGASNPELLLAAGELFREAGDLERAREAFARLQREFPASPQALPGAIEEARVWYNEGRIAQALQKLEDLADATGGQPQRLTVLRALGGLYEDLGIASAVKDVYGQIAAISAEPEMMAQAALALLNVQAWNEGLDLADRIDLDRLGGATAYRLLLKQGEALLQIDTRRGLDMLEQAYEAYPQQRTAEGDQRLLQANLAAGRTARARVIIEELQQRVDRGLVEPQRLEQAAVTWGDHLFNRRDYRAAADAYLKALNRVNLTPGPQAPPPLTQQQQWALYQRANALHAISDYERSLPLYEILAKTGSLWAREAQARADAARIELRLRGMNPQTLQNMG